MVSASGRDIAFEPLVAGHVPGVEFGGAGDVTGIGEGEAARVHQAADMVAMHMGDHHGIDLIGRVSCGFERPGDAARG